MVPSLLPLALLFLVAPAYPFRAAGASSLLWTHGSSFGGGGILTSDNHNSLYTRATVSSPSPCPLRCPSRFALLVLVWTSPFSLSFSLGLFSSLLRRVVSSPLVPRSSCRIDHEAIPQLFSTFLALVAVAACKRISRAFRYHVLYWSFYPSLFFFRFLSFVFFIVHPSLLPAVWHPRLASISRAVAPSSGLSRFLPPSTLPFILEMGIGIHETKLMITTSKQRAERPTATCRVIYKSSFSSYIPLSSLTDPTRSLICFLFLSLSFLLFLRSIFSFSEMSFHFHCFLDVLTVVNKEDRKYSRVRIRSFCFTLAVSFRASNEIRYADDGRGSPSR